MKKRVLIISDLHCGHLAGLTPSKWQLSIRGDHDWDKFAILQRELWDNYTRVVRYLGNVDLLIVNGDLIDGRGERSGSTELITTDRHKQCDMAVAALNIIKTKNTVITYGTPYHTGEQEDFEKDVAKEIGASKIGSHEWIDVNGVIFDCKHHVSSSNNPYNRSVSVAKDRLWNVLWAEHEEQPKADIIIRSHVHYHEYCGGSNWLAMTTPSLQGMGSKFGSRKCSGHVDFGVIHFDVDSDGSYTWQSHILRIPSQKAQTLKF
jgi:hypothetical protein